MGSVTHRSQEERTCHTIQGHLGKHQGTEEKAWVKAFIVVFMGKNGQGSLQSWAGLGLDSMTDLNNVSGLWDIEIVPSSLVPGPGVTRAST